MNTKSHIGAVRRLGRPWMEGCAAACLAVTVGCQGEPPSRSKGWQVLAEAEDDVPARESQAPYLVQSVGGPFELDAHELRPIPTPRVVGVDADERDLTSRVISSARVRVHSDGTDGWLDSLELRTPGVRGWHVRSRAGAVVQVLASSPHHISAIALVPVEVRGHWSCADKGGEKEQESYYAPTHALVHLDMRDVEGQRGEVLVRASLPLPDPVCKERAPVVGLRLSFRVRGTFEGAEVIK